MTTQLPCEVTAIDITRNDDGRCCVGIAAPNYIYIHFQSDVEGLEESARLAIAKTEQFLRETLLPGMNIKPLDKYEPSLFGE